MEGILTRQSHLYIGDVLLVNLCSVRLRRSTIPSKATQEKREAYKLINGRKDPKKKALTRTSRSVQVHNTASHQRMLTLTHAQFYHVL